MSSKDHKISWCTCQGGRAHTVLHAIRADGALQCTGCQRVKRRKSERRQNGGAQ